MPRWYDFVINYFFPTSWSHNVRPREEDMLGFARLCFMLLFKWWRMPKIVLNYLCIWAEYKLIFILSSHFT